MSEPTQEQPAVTPAVTTAPAGSGWSRIPNHLGRSRTSTVVLSVLFVAIFALYLNIRPEPTAPATAGTSGEVPASAPAPAPKTSATRTAPTTATTATESTGETSASPPAPATGSEPTTSAVPSDTTSPRPQTTRSTAEPTPTGARSLPTPTETAPTG